MPTVWSLTLDCHDAPRLARFWATALGYVDRAPPEGWDSWEAWLRHFEVPEHEWDHSAALCDPDGVLPSISIVRVPEPKSAKNRWHIDLQVSGGRQLDASTRTARIEAKVAELAALDGRVLARYDHDGALDHVVMADPEGNELCVV